MIEELKVLVWCFFHSEEIHDGKNYHTLKHAEKIADKWVEINIKNHEDEILKFLGVNSPEDAFNMMLKILFAGAD